MEKIQVVKILEARKNLRIKCNECFTDKDVADSIYSKLIEAIDWDCEWYGVDENILEQGAECCGK